MSEPVDYGCCNKPCLVLSHLFFDENFLFNFLVDHKLILREIHCPKCKFKCKLDSNRKSFRCQRSIPKNKLYPGNEAL